MKHYGDITKISGYEVPIVDIVTGGSPCQDLSIAGKRAGLAGERSGLFMEQVRIIKEMREHDRETNSGAAKYFSTESADFLSFINGRDVSRYGQAKLRSFRLRLQSCDSAMIRRMHGAYLETNKRQANDTMRRMWL